MIWHDQQLYQPVKTQYYPIERRIVLNQKMKMTKNHKNESFMTGKIKPL